MTYDVQGQGDSDLLPTTGNCGPSQVEAGNLLCQGVPYQQNYNFFQGAEDSLNFFLSGVNPDGANLNHHDIALAGHSLGALFAASFARYHPDRVSALALISPALGYGVAPGAALPDGVQSRIDEICELGPAAFAKKRAARLVGDPQARPEIVAAVQEAMGSVNPAMRGCI